MKIQGHPNICSCLGCFDAYRPGTSQAREMSSSLEERASSEGFVPDIFQILSCILIEDSFQSIPASGASHGGGRELLQGT